MSLPTIAGSVNAVPATRNLVIEGSNSVTLNIADNGNPTTLNVDSDGNGFDSGAVSGRVAVLGGTTSGRDHFPWPAQDGTLWDGSTGEPGNQIIGAGTSYPIGVDLDTAAKWLLRVKSWQIDVPGFHSFEYGVDFPSFSFTADPFSGIDRESDLVNPLVAAVGGYFNFSGDCPGAMMIWNADFIVGMFGDWATGLSFYEDQFYPIITFQIVAWAGDYFGVCPPDDVPDNNSKLLHTNPADLGPIPIPTAAANLVLDGVNVPIYPKNAGDTISDVIATPIEFWPYATRNGNQVYNTGDGSIINDPLS